MSHIFISYQREDRQKAEGLAQWFAQRGWGVWWDRELHGGQAFTQVITQKLETAHTVVVLWSKGSVHSNWVIDEASRAQDRLVPVLIEKVRPPLGYGSLHTF